VPSISPVQWPDELWVETVPEPACASLDAPLPPAQWQECEEFVARVARIGEDLLGLPPTVPSVRVLDVWQFSPSNMY